MTRGKYSIIQANTNTAPTHFPQLKIKYGNFGALSQLQIEYGNFGALSKIEKRIWEFWGKTMNLEV